MSKKRKVLIILSCILGFFLIAGLIIGIFVARNLSVENDAILEKKAYEFKGTILSIQDIDDVFKVAIEFIPKSEEDGSAGNLKLIVLKANEAISNIMLRENVKVKAEDKVDYTPIFGDYNNDGNKDFTFAKEENIYKLYTIDASGNAKEMQVNNEINGILVPSRRNSILLETYNSGFMFEKYDENLKKFIQSYFIWKDDMFNFEKQEESEFQKIQLSVFFDGFKIDSIPGKYKLETKNKDVNTYRASDKSKISLSKSYNAIPRRIDVLNEVPKEIINVNSFLNDYYKKAVKVDFDGDKKDEYLLFIRKIGENESSKVLLTDSEYNIIDVLGSDKTDFTLYNNIEIADIDNDSVMEIVIAYSDNTVSVHKYNLGFLFGETAK